MNFYHPSATRTELRHKLTGLILSAALIALVTTPAQAEVSTFIANADSEEWDASAPTPGQTDENSSDLELDNDGGEQIVAVQFKYGAFAQGGNVDSAYVQFTAKDTSSAPSTVTIWGEVLYSSSLGDDDFDISTRTRTSASVTWTIPAWTSGDAGLAQQTPDLSAIVNEIIASENWTYGDDKITLIFDGDGTADRNAYSVENGDSGRAPMLVVDQEVHTVNFNVFEDWNGNAIQDAGEATVSLDLGIGSFYYTSPTSVTFPKGTTRWKSGRPPQAIW